MKIFVSHIGEESKLAMVLKEWVESSFAGQCEVFVSSDEVSIPAGSKWLEKIDEALEDAAVLVVLCSKKSLARPWINFETGCCWNKKVPIIPVCHSGQKRNLLPPPISSFQALELEDDKFVNRFLAGLGDHLGFPKVPRIDEANMKKELLAATSSNGSEPESLPEAPIDGGGEELAPDLLEILKVLAQIADNHPTVERLASGFSASVHRMKYFLEQLDERNLISRSYAMGRPSTVTLSAEGRKYLFERGML
jgi:TIR domain